jgi:hypothetical protein
MKFGPMEKGVIKVACKKLAEYINENNGRIELNLDSINNWLKDNSIFFKLKINTNGITIETVKE